MHVIWTALLVIMILVTTCHADTTLKGAGKEIGQGFNKIGKDTGKAFKEGGKEVGQGFKNLGKETGKAFKEGVRETGPAAKKTGRSVGDWFKNLGHSIKRFFSGA